MLQTGQFDVVSRFGVVRCADYGMAVRVRAALGQGYLRAVYVVAGGAR